MDPPRTRSRSRSGFYHFGMNGNVGSGNAVGNGSMMNASGGGVNYPPQSNPGWAPHHGGRSYPESQQQHAQGSYLSAGAQRHSAHGAHRHPGAAYVHVSCDVDVILRPILSISVFLVCGLQEDCFIFIQIMCAVRIGINPSLYFPDQPSP
ncbi:hypothetical protein F7725_010247 [Dissostichus mawsoni]|uniref:Uncharacterized protein n=1 Tax=Dissostichus mawsoni TaxID=36200 RepID=A0A7J5XPK0_DISMA|nr:hypothetical protein F7725_010247 [Dissostichus mawsoni]